MAIVEYRTQMTPRWIEKRFSKSELQTELKKFCYSGEDLEHSKAVLASTLYTAATKTWVGNVVKNNGWHAYGWEPTLEQKMANIAPFKTEAQIQEALTYYHKHLNIGTTRARELHDADHKVYTLDHSKPRGYYIFCSGTAFCSEDKAVVYRFSILQQRLNILRRQQELDECLSELKVLEQ